MGVRATSLNRAQVKLGETIIPCLGKYITCAAPMGSAGLNSVGNLNKNINMTKQASDFYAPFPLR